MAIRPPAAVGDQFLFSIFSNFFKKIKTLATGRSLLMVCRSPLPAGGDSLWEEGGQRELEYEGILGIIKKIGGIGRSWTLVAGSLDLKETGKTYCLL